MIVTGRSCRRRNSLQGQTPAAPRQHCGSDAHTRRSVVSGSIPGSRTRCGQVPSWRSGQQPARSGEIASLHRRISPLNAIRIPGRNLLDGIQGINPLRMAREIGQIHVGRRRIRRDRYFPALLDLHAESRPVTSNRWLSNRLRQAGLLDEYPARSLCRLAGWPKLPKHRRVVPAVAEGRPERSSGPGSR